MRLFAIPARSFTARNLRILSFLLAVVALTPRIAWPKVTMAPSGLALSDLEPFEIVIAASGDLPDISCFALTLEYNPSVIELVSSTEGDLFAMGPHPTFFSEDTDQQGRPVLSDCTLGFRTTVTPPGELVRLTFQPLTGGTTTISIVDGTVRDQNRAIVPEVAFEGSSVAIAGTSAPVALEGSLRVRPWPNPSSGTVALRIDGPVAGAVTLTELQIHDLVGRLVRRVPVSSLDALSWDGRDRRGQVVAGGVYFAVLMGRGIALPTAKILRVD